ncbi:RND efflux system, outer membrane lipoprotein, NodT family [Methylocella tundrae]|uniref:RND efflux system, outer membrane lipoprotein, NodT family n=2 Tax=Methylocella tundrae TaxID=227605 RepID=A0A8B6M287_METTU|nr:RND efflux system, outer membrane lipoprotein, NodT family [Methylocella tundrae]
MATPAEADMAKDGARSLNRALRRALAAALLPCLAGCAVGPDFGPPAAPVADHYLEAHNRAIGTGRQDYRDWWKVFHDPVLNRLIEIAYDQNLTLLSAGTRVLQARAELGVAIGELYPQQQQGVGLTTYNRPSHADAASDPQLQLNNFWQSQLGARAAWELDFWGKFRRGVESADAAYLATVASYDDVLVTLLGDVAKTYIGIRTLEKQIAIARANIVRQKEALQIARDRFSGGTATKLDVYQAENVLGQTEASIPQLTMQLQHGQNALRVFLGMTPEPLDPLLARSTGKIPVPPAKIFVGIPTDLLRRRPDVRAAELKAAAQSAQIGVAQSELYPAISLTGRIGGSASTINGARLSSIFTPAGLAYSFGPSFQWNILNYGQITNNVRLQDATLQQYLVDYQNTVLKAQQDVENGVSTYLQSKIAVEALRRSVAAANGALGISLLEYQQGTRDYTSVLTSEQNLLQAQNDLVIAEGNVPLGVTMVYEALGGGWQIRDGNDFVPPATNAQMRARTDWGDVLPPAGAPKPPPPALAAPTPGLPGPENEGPTVRAPEF